MEIEEIYRMLKNTLSMDKKASISKNLILGWVLMIIIVAIGLYGNYKLLSTNEEPNPHFHFMYFQFEDGPNIDDEHGCFFILRAKHEVNISNPTMYSFYVSEFYRPYEDKRIHGITFRLNFSERYYVNGVPMGGDRNASYDWWTNGSSWTDDECIGFDMPKKEMNINIENGNWYEVIIKNAMDEIIYCDYFEYRDDGIVD